MRHKLIVLCGMALLVGCASQCGSGQAGAAVEDRSAKPVETPQVAMVNPQEPAGSALADLQDPKSTLSKRSVYFDFDQVIIKDEFKPLIEAHAKFLVANPAVKILIQGNTDERGSREYNLALGQKRAEALKKALLLLGATEDQVEAVSLGEEKPKAAGHGEAFWAENRRDDMLYPNGY